MADEVLFPHISISYALYPEPVNAIANPCGRTVRTFRIERHEDSLAHQLTGVHPCCYPCCQAVSRLAVVEAAMI